MFLGGLSATEQHKDRLSEKDLRVLIATAQTPEQHLQLARHYRAESNEYLKRQKQHEADADSYGRTPSRYHPTASQHCRERAYHDGESAKNALALAEMHEAMAREGAK